MNTFIECFRVELLSIANYCDATVALYIHAIYELLSFLKWQFGISFVEAKSFHLVEWFIYQRDERKLSANTLNIYKASATKYFAYLDTLGVIEKNPAAAIPRSKIRTDKQNKVIPGSVVAQLLDSFDLSTWTGLRDRLMSALLWTLGLRVSELIAIRLKDLRLDYDPKHFIGMLLVHGKGRKERSLFITSRLYKVLVHYLAHSRSPKSKNDPLICHPDFTPLNRDKVRNLVKSAARKAGINRKIHPHLLRHTFATEMYHQGVPVDALRHILGHSSTTDTSLYIHIAEKVKVETLEHLTTGRSL